MSNVEGWNREKRMSKGGGTPAACVFFGKSGCRSNWGLTMLFSCGKLVLFIVEDFCGSMEVCFVGDCPVGTGWGDAGNG